MTIRLARSTASPAASPDVPPSRWRTELRSFCELFALTGGLIATAVYARSSGVRLWLRYATPAPLVFALLFVTVSPAGKLVLPGGQETGRARAWCRPTPGRRW
jgi:hypothetical protein